MRNLKIRILLFGLIAVMFTGCEADRNLNFGHRRNHLFFRTNRATFSPLDTLNVPQGLVDDLDSIRYKRLTLKYYTAKQWKTRQENTPLMERRAQFRMRPGTTFELKVRDEPEISGRYVAGPDGTISLSLVKEPIPVEGKTYEEVRQTLREALQAYIKNPEVTVNAVLIKKDDSDTFKGGSIVMLGAYGDGGSSDGRVPAQIVNLTGENTFLRTMAESGGVGGNADMQNIVVMRQIEGEVNVIICDFQRLTQFGDMSQDIRILDGDIIYVPLRENSFKEQFFFEWNTLLNLLAGLITVDFAKEQFEDNNFLGF